MKDLGLPEGIRYFLVVVQTFSPDHLGMIGTFFLLVRFSQSRLTRLRLFSFWNLDALVRHGQLKYGRMLAFV